MNFDDTHNEYSDSVDASSDARMCPYCETRPLVNWKKAKTCGSIGCTKEHDRISAAIRRKEKHDMTPKKQQPLCSFCNERPLVNRKDAQTCGSDECKHKRMLSHHRSYRRRDDVKIRRKEWEKTPRQKEIKRVYAQKRYHDPKVKEKQKAYAQQPEIRAKTRNYLREYNQLPEVKLKKKVYYERYRKTPGIKQKLCKKASLRGKPYPRGHGGATKQWEVQRHQCALGGSSFDGHSYPSVKTNLHTDHLVPVKLLQRVGIVNKKVINAIDNLWLVSKSKNQWKSDKPLHVWLSEIGEPDPVVDMGRQWYEHTVGLIVQAQQAIDPAFVLTDEKKRILGLDK